MSDIKFKAKLALGNTIISYAKQQDKKEELEELYNNILTIIKSESFNDTKIEIDITNERDYVVNQISTRLKNSGFYVQKKIVKDRSILKVCWNDANTFTSFRTKYNDIEGAFRYDMTNGIIEITKLKSKDGYLKFMSVHTVKDCGYSIVDFCNRTIPDYELFTNNDEILEIKIDKQTKSNGVCRLINMLQNGKIKIPCDKIYIDGILDEFLEGVETNEQGFYNYKGSSELIALLIQMMIGVEEFTKCVAEMFVDIN